MTFSENVWLLIIGVAIGFATNLLTSLLTSWFTTRQQERLRQRLKREQAMNAVGQLFAHPGLDIDGIHDAQDLVQKYLEDESTKIDTDVAVGMLEGLLRAIK
jgi:hypothetical protein